jgi:hypothetical protein
LGKEKTMANINKNRYDEDGLVCDSRVSQLLKNHMPLFAIAPYSNVLCLDGALLHYFE